MSRHSRAELRQSSVDSWFDVAVASPKCDKCSALDGQCGRIQARLGTADFNKPPMEAPRRKAVWLVAARAHPRSCPKRPRRSRGLPRRSQRCHLSLKLPAPPCIRPSRGSRLLGGPNATRSQPLLPVGVAIAVSVASPRRLCLCRRASAAFTGVLGAVSGVGGRRLGALLRSQSRAGSSVRRRCLSASVAPPASAPTAASFRDGHAVPWERADALGSRGRHEGA
eukprot:296200-Chlamydomonas_euryale.AAC.4